MLIKTATTKRLPRSAAYLQRVGMILAAGHLETLAGILERPEAEGRAFLETLLR
jgi:hypothetical protein